MRDWAVYWRVGWLVLLLVVGAAAGVSAVASDPDWGGTEPENVSNSLTNKAWQPVIVSGPLGQMVVAWSDQMSDGVPRNIYVRRSYDSGRSWSAPQVVSETALMSALPDALFVGSRAFVAWVDQRTVGGENAAIYEAELEATDTRFIPSSTSLLLMSTRPRLAAGAGKLHVVFNAGANILHAMRPLAGTTWPTATRIYTSGIGAIPLFPVLAVGPDGSTLHVVWQEADLGTETEAIVYKRGQLSGTKADWESALILATSDGHVFYPVVAADSAGNLHVVWGEEVEEADQYVRYTRCDIASSQWISPAVRIDAVPFSVNKQHTTYTHVDLALWETDNQVEVCVAWHGFREGGAEDVLVSCSRDGGQTWSAPQNVSGSGYLDATSIAPSIAFDASGNLHAVWQEHNAEMGTNVVENTQVYYAHSLKRFFLPLVMRK